MYMVTICVHHMEPRFGTVIDGQMHLNTAGEIADRHWRNLPRRFSELSLDAYVIMPNHLHGILAIGDDLDGGPHLSLGRIVGAYKSMVSSEYAACVRAEMFPPFDRSLWLRGFQDRIVRDDQMLDTLRHYIQGNPGRWTEKYG